MKKILVVDDSYTIRQSTVELLKAEGFDAIAAENGQQGIQIAKDYLPDMVLCDVTMPELDGYEVLTTLRQNSTTAAIPFIFLTARAAKEDIRLGMELGADDYLTKPFTAAELLGAITSRFEKHHTVLNQSQKQLDDLRTSIALSLPHELRTPLHGILGLSEVLIEDYQRIQPEEVREIADGIHQSAERLYRLIQNFLLYADLEMTASDPDRIATLRAGETFFPHSLISSIATQIAQRHGREADLQLNLQTMRVSIADIKLKKVVEELVENAFKFSKPGTPVTLTAIAHETAFTLYISDRGRGMTPEQVAALGAYIQFDRRIHEQQGSGLGLTIAKRLVELHGGTFSIDSDPEHQTIIQLTLPGGD